MFIKTFNSSNETVIVNINVADSKLIRVDGTKLVFEMKTEETKTHELFSNDKAKAALDSLFVTLGASSPLDKTLNLTGIDDSSVSPVGMTIEEIAKKLKKDPRKISIVYMPSSKKYIEDKEPTKVKDEQSDDEESLEPENNNQ